MKPRTEKKLRGNIDPRGVSGVYGSNCVLSAAAQALQAQQETIERYGNTLHRIAGSRESTPLCTAEEARILARAALGLIPVTAQAGRQAYIRRCEELSAINRARNEALKVRQAKFDAMMREFQAKMVEECRRVNEIILAGLR